MKIVDGGTAVCLSGGIDSYIMYKLLTTKGSPISNNEPGVPIYVMNPYVEYSSHEIYKVSQYSQPIILHSFLEQSQHDLEGGFIDYRNLDVALSVSEAGFDKALFAATAEDRVSDSSPEFRKHLSLVLSESLDRPFRIESPTEKYTKKELIEMYLTFVPNASINVLEKETFSCYNPMMNGNECYVCKACFRKNVVLNEYGIFKPFYNEKLIRSYLQDNTLPKERKVLIENYVKKVKEKEK